MNTLNFESGEKEIGRFRKHWFVIGVEIGFLFLFAIAPIIIILFFQPGFILSLKLKLFLGMLYLAWLTLLWILGFLAWTNYYLDVWILTNKRVIDIDQKKLFHRDVATLRLENIQDIRVEMQGVLNTMLKIGDIHIQTSSMSKEFEMIGIENPFIVKEMINKAHQEKVEEVKTVRIEAPVFPVIP